MKVSLIPVAPVTIKRTHRLFLRVGLTPPPIYRILFPKAEIILRICKINSPTDNIVLFIRKMVSSIANIVLLTCKIISPIRNMVLLIHQMISSIFLYFPAGNAKKHSK
ncbi:MAG TPA: hypothetical protein DDW50_02265 [Firmicutes bacterium]|jgi:hypothetical protein|nr:hypothetical protein [Bacillota bacterium]